MAMSYGSSHVAFQHSNPAMAAFQQSDVMKDICFCDGCLAPNTFIDSFNPDDFIQAENDYHFLPNLSVPEPSLHVPPTLFLSDDLEFGPCTKRFRGHNNLYSAEFGFGCSRGASYPAPELFPEFLFPPEELQIPLMGSHGGADSSGKPIGASSSAQSIAARQRRKRISEKTQELGKLIPGGNKLNTAEMLQAAFKYVKFLQAQVAILELMGPSLGSEVAAASHAEALHTLLSSTVVQEKLYEEEKCVVPAAVAEALAKDPKLHSRPSISRGLHQLAQSMG
ncbi:hypothetical protein ACLOJK_021395 [Asimina triloba]